MGEVMWQKRDLHLVVLDRALVVLHRALILEHHLFLVLQRLARNGILGPRILIALQIHLRFGQQILVAIERALRLDELRLVGPRIDIDQRIAFAHILAFAVMDGRNHARDLRGDGVGVSRRDGADGVEIDADASPSLQSRW